MPAAARPTPRPGGAADRGLVRYTRRYVDALLRPMSGTVTFTGSQRAETGDTVIAVAPVLRDLVDGWVSVDLPPDVYTAVAMLQTLDGDRASDISEVDLTG